MHFTDKFLNSETILLIDKRNLLNFNGCILKETHLGKKHIFHIVDDDFPLPEEGIIGLPYLHRYDRYSVTNEYLFLNKVQVRQHDNGKYICKKTVQVRKIDVPTEEGEV